MNAPAILKVETPSFMSGADPEGVKHLLEELKGQRLVALLSEQRPGYLMGAGAKTEFIPFAAPAKHWWHIQGRMLEALGVVTPDSLGELSPEGDDIGWIMYDGRTAEEQTRGSETEASWNLGPRSTGRVMAIGQPGPQLAIPPNGEAVTSVAIGAGDPDGLITRGQLKMVSAGSGGYASTAIIPATTPRRLGRRAPEFADQPRLIVSIGSDRNVPGIPIHYAKEILAG